MKFIYAPGATPIDPDEALGLIPKHIAMQAELNAWEQENILQAENWIYSRKHKEVLTLDFIRLLHKKMFNFTWNWAGKFRQSNKIIGIDYCLIAEELKKLLDDIQYHLIHSTYSNDEIATRFHHRLVKIHPFPNGNGRHARLMTDVLLLTIKHSPFTWGSASLSDKSKIRETYIQALRKADRFDYQPLLAFVRS